MRIIILMFFTVQILLVSCGNPQKNRMLALKNKEIIFPNNMTAKIGLKDTLCSELLSEPKYKFVVLVDSTGCTGCKLQFSDWKRFVYDNKDLKDYINIVYIINTNNIYKVAAITNQQEYQYPIFYDKANQMQKLNNLPDYSTVNCYLLDKENKITLVGNPLQNKQIEKMFYEEVEKRLK